MIGLRISADDDTRRLFEVVVWCMQQYCDYSKEAAVGAVNRVYEQYRDRFDDDFYHHEGPYRIALLIYYVDKLCGNDEDFSTWLLASNRVNEPPEALEYFRAHYLKREEGRK